MKGMGPIDLQRQPNQREIQGSTIQKNHWDPSHLPQANKDGDRPFSCCPGTPRDPADPPEGRQGSGRKTSTEQKWRPPTRRPKPPQREGKWVLGELDRPTWKVMGPVQKEFKVPGCLK